MRKIVSDALVQEEQAIVPAQVWQEANPHWQSGV